MISKACRSGFVLAGLWMVLGWVGQPSVGAQELPRPPGIGDQRGGGGQPDPLTLFNQHAELADGELYLLKGEVTLAPGLLGSRRIQPYFNVDLEAHAWLSNKSRKEGADALYLIEGPVSFWRLYENSYGELAAEAHVQVFVTSDGKALQVISLKPIPELSSIPKHSL